MSNPLMQLDGVSFAYERGLPVLHEISATIEPGKLYVVTGPNAAGKSTLIRLMLGQLSESQGRITLDGKRVRRMSSRRRASLMSYVPQRAQVGFPFSVREVVAMGRYALPHDESAVDEAIHRCDLGPIADRPYPQLSVGQQQRVLLARALAQSAGGGRIMLLDEPTSAMDLRHVLSVLRILRRQVEAELAVVAVLHDLNLAAAAADDVWLLHEGRLAAAGDWSEVLIPRVLEPVYGVKIQTVHRPVDPSDPMKQRPLFDAQLSDRFGSQ